MARTGKWPARIALAVSAAMIATLFTVINASGQSGGGEALPTVGIEVQSASNTQVTYAIVVRNQGTAQSTNVRVRSNVPTNTTFESSNPPPTATTSPSPGVASCDNAGTREDPGRTCEWSFGTVPAGETRQITAVYNLNQANVATYTVSISATVTDGEGHSNSDTDASLIRSRQDINDDTWVNDDEPPNWNHGQCPNLRVLQNNRVTSFLEADTMPAANTVERVWGALLQAQVQSTSYTQASPGSIGAHRITSGDWTEGANDSASNQNCPGAASSTTTDARTGAEPQSAQNATATAPITGFPQFASWDVTADLDDVSERGAAFNGWELRDVIGSGDNFTRFHSGEAASDQMPRLFLVYTTEEAATCVDADPETDTNPFGTEHVMTAFVTDGAQVKNNGGDACNGGPAIDTVIWEIEDDDPDAYFSSQEGQPITKTIQSGDANPNTITTTAEDGTTFVGMRQNAPAPGENRVEARIVESSQDPTDTDDTSDPDPGGENRPACSIPQNPTGADCDGENPEHDDVRKSWNASGASSGTTGTASSTTTGSPSGTSPSPSGSASSPSPSGSTTGSPSGTSPSGTSPSRSASTTGTSTASSSSPAQSARSISLFASSNEVVYPAQVTLSGTITSADNDCDNAGEFVRIERRILGQTEYSLFESRNTDADGRFEVSFASSQSAEYRAIAPAHDQCADASSTPQTVTVKVKITGRAGRRSVERGSTVGIVGRVKPDHDGTEVLLQRRKGRRWVTIARADLNVRSRYRFVVDAGWKGRRTFRTVWEAQDQEHESNNSKNIVIRTTRP
ncbi:MAG: DUF11 domain-containing protein [Actinomycetota bacterium]|nr:DUF11 domain-containing protein [Actinomycetota bacterium]